MTPEEIAAQVAAKWYTQPFGLLADPERALALFIENAIRVAIAETAAPELLAACEMVIKAAIGNNPPRYLDEFIAEGMGRLNVCLTPDELTQLKDALARAD